MSSEISSPQAINHNAQTARFLMCAPDHFEVTYKINPWMQPPTWKKAPDRLSLDVHKEWKALFETFKSIGAQIELVSPQPGLPDMVFTANAAVVLDGSVLLSRFRHKERQGEEKFFKQKFEALKEIGLLNQLDEFPPGIIQEGAGDCLWDSMRQAFWAGHGPRSSKESISYLQDYYKKEVIGLELADPLFYHVDLSMSPLQFGQVMYYPEAFTEKAQKVIKERVPAGELITVNKEDAYNFVCNLININDKIVISACSQSLKNKLKEYGYTVIETPVNTFGLAGGAVCCLTLKLHLLSNNR